MIIRSQSKKVIIPLNQPVYIEKTSDRWGVSTERFFLGTYSTEEKAIKVLDMIQEAYIKDCALYIDRESNAKVIPQNRGFQMPSDEEVEV